MVSLLRLKIDNLEGFGYSSFVPWLFLLERLNMAADSPDAFIPDFMQRALTANPSPSGVPKFESLLILGLLQKYGPFKKGDLAGATSSRLGDDTLTKVCLRYIDYLVSLGYVSKQSLVYYITAPGAARILELKEEMSAALNFVTLSV